MVRVQNVLRQYHFFRNVDMFDDVDDLEFFDEMYLCSRGRFRVKHEIG